MFILVQIYIFKNLISIHNSYRKDFIKIRIYKNKNNGISFVGQNDHLKNNFLPHFQFNFSSFKSVSCNHFDQNIFLCFLFFFGGGGGEVWRNFLFRKTHKSSFGQSKKKFTSSSRNFYFFLDKLAIFHFQN